MRSQGRGQKLVIDAIQHNHGLAGVALVQVKPGTQQRVSLPVAFLQFIRLDGPQQGAGRPVIARPQFGIGGQQAVIIRTVSTAFG